MATKPKGLLIDLTKCVGCRACVLGCRELHGQPAEQPPRGYHVRGAYRSGDELTATSWTVIEDYDGKFVRRLCQHCVRPACVAACMVGALSKSALGPVVYDDKKCCGCRYCIQACPYQVPKYEWTKIVPYMRKCDMCSGRVAQGQQTQCAEVCPTGATLFGERDALLEEARKRLREDSAYVHRIYGETELGGTSVLYITDVPFEKLGFITPPSDRPMPTLMAAGMEESHSVVLIGGPLLAGLYWITQRRRAVLLAEGKLPKDGK
jgi:formate dehydrogenase iron-sulfur subunit